MIASLWLNGLYGARKGVVDRLVLFTYLEQLLELCLLQDYMNRVQHHVIRYAM